MAVPTLAASAWSELWATATAAGRQTGLGWLVCLRVALPVEFGIWRIDGGLRTVPFIKLGDESRLEDILLRDVSVLARCLGPGAGCHGRWTPGSYLLREAH